MMMAAAPRKAAAINTKNAIISPRVTPHLAAGQKALPRNGNI